MAERIVADIEESGIYQIRNLTNGKRYVGSTYNFRSRWHNHRSQLRRGIHGNIKLQAAWEKIGSELFSFEIIELCGKERLKEREQHWLDTSLPEYNIARFARNYPGHPCSQDKRRKISEANKGNKSCLGRVMSPETRERIRAAKFGKKLGP